MIQILKNLFKHLILIVIILNLVFLLCACIDKNTTINENGQNDNVNVELKEEKKYIEQMYGIADNPVYGKRIIHTETETKQATYTEKINEDSKGGSVFYQMVEPEKDVDGLVCVYLTDKDNNGIVLKSTYIYNIAFPSSGSYTTTLTTSTAKNRCYAIVKNNYFVSVELSEQKDDLDDELMFHEKISVYKLFESNMEEMYTISRRIKSSINEIKQFEIQSDSEWIVYASGYENYTAEGAELVSTQEEFCNKANNLLESSLLNCITFNKTSWSNRWFGMEIDESGINKDMVKVDFSYSEPEIEKNGDEAIDIIIKINDEKQQLIEDKKLEEIEDYPVTYDQNTETMIQDTIVMPENIPQSVDVSDLQDLRYFNIDGFWYSSDYKYVYHIYTQQPDGGFGTLYFADLDSKAGAKHGQVKQTSSYSVILRAMEDNGFSPEVFAVNNKLISDDITLERVDDSIIYNLTGKWTNGDVTYTFDTDGKYHVDSEDNSYWGGYFVINETDFVLGETMKNLKLQSYKIEGDILTINNSLSLTRQ